MFQRAKIKLEGVVQGVGFRPFIHRLSKRWGLAGFVANTSYGVEIEVEGGRRKLINFYNDIQKELPALARITKKDIRIVSPKGYKDFIIQESKKTPLSSVLISPDIATCYDCYKELFSSQDPRPLYPFINCTNCGPRFSIIQNLPYDRPFTTMKKFKMCLKCKREYKDISNRRYHAQPNACPVCGPQVKLLKSEKTTVNSTVHQTGASAEKRIKRIATNNQAIVMAIRG